VALPVVAAVPAPNALLFMPATPVGGAPTVALPVPPLDGESLAQPQSTSSAALNT